MISERTLQSDELRAVGCVAIESSILDRLLEAIICDACGFDSVKQELFTGKLMFAAKADAVKEILLPKLRSKKRRDRLTELHAAMKLANSQRVTALHGQWQWESSREPHDIADGRLYRAVSTHKKRRVTASQLMSIAHSLSAVHREMQLFYLPMIRRRKSH
jgi:hypothetical protein